MKPWLTYENMHVIKMFHTKKSDQEINSMPNEALVIKSEAM